MTFVPSNIISEERIYPQKADFSAEADAYEAEKLASNAPVGENGGPILPDEECARLAARVRELEEREVWMRAALEEAERLLSVNSSASSSVALIREVLKTGRAEPTYGNINLNIHTIAVGGVDDHAGGVVPLSIKRSSDEEANAWATADGRAVYYMREWAEKADYMKTDQYRNEVEAYYKARRLLSAKVIALDEYDGWVNATGDEDDYAANIEDLLEKHRDHLAWNDVSEADIPVQLPAWVYCCTEDVFHFDIEDAIQSYLDDNHHEDAAEWIKDWDGLGKFWSEWSAKQKDLRSQAVDYSRIIVLDPVRYEEELAEATKVLEASR